MGETTRQANFWKEAIQRETRAQNNAHQSNQVRMLMNPQLSKYSAHPPARPNTVGPMGVPTEIRIPGLILRNCNPPKPQLRSRSAPVTPNPSWHYHDETPGSNLYPTSPMKSSLSPAQRANSVRPSTASPKLQQQSQMPFPYTTKVPRDFWKQQMAPPTPNNQPNKFYSYNNPNPNPNSPTHPINNNIFLTPTKPSLPKDLGVPPPYSPFKNSGSPDGHKVWMGKFDVYADLN